MPGRSNSPRHASRDASRGNFRSNQSRGPSAGTTGRTRGTRPTREAHCRWPVGRHAMILAFSGFADLPRWVGWRNQSRGDRTTKVPYSPHGGPAKANDPATWGTLDAAETWARRHVNGDGGGIGIELGDLGNGRSL